MPLVDFQSRYSFYTPQPPAVDYIGNTDAKGFITEKQPQGASDFVGILGSNATGLKYEHTGIRNLGNMTTNLRPLDANGNPTRDTFVRGSVGNFTTRYQNNADDIPSITARGFERDGVSSIIISRTAKDEFPIDDVTFSDRGIAKRRAQLGDGSKFPIGPAGQVHNFDIIRTGFNDQSRYGDTYGPKSNSGLADTYTANSPIDDVYNKYKVRDEAYNPFTFPATRQPFILRGIQRNDNSDPQRYGFINDFNVGPRAGLITSLSRSSVDRARIAKFLISPKGLGYNLKQFGLQAMNPNVEDAFGGASRRPRLTQLYDPFSVLINIGAPTLGIHKDRHGFPLSLFPKRGKYEEVFKERGVLLGSVVFNRLRSLYMEYRLSGESRYDNRKTRRGQASDTLTAAGGAQSILGIGRTRISRGDDTTIMYKNGNNHTHGFGTLGPSRALGDRNVSDIKGRQNDQRNPYVKPGKTRQDMDDGSGILLTNEIPMTSFLFSNNRNSALRIYHNSLAKALEKNNLWLDHTGITPTRTKDPNKYGGGVSTNYDESGQALGTAYGKRRFKTMNYDLIRLIASKRDVDTTTVHDFVNSAKYGVPMVQNVSADKAPRHFMYAKAYTRYEQTTKRFRGETEDDEMVLIALGDEYDRANPEASRAYPFNAYIVSLSDSFNPSYKNDNDVGVPIPRYQMESYTRSISMEILTAAENSEHLDNIWNNIGGVATKATPSGTAPFAGRTLKLNVGRLYRNLTVVMKAFTISFDNETLWDIRANVELPKMATISMEFDVLTTEVHFPWGQFGAPNAVPLRMIKRDKKIFTDRNTLPVVDPSAAAPVRNADGAINDPSSAPIIPDDSSDDDFFFG